MTGQGPRFLLTLVLAIQTAACDREQEASQDAGKARATRPVRHVLLIVIDTLRADALSVDGDRGADASGVARLAADGIVFTQARSAVSWTLPSMSSLMTGWPATVHKVARSRNALPAQLPTIATHMRDAGYHTAAAGNNSLLTPRSRMNLGFREYHLPVQHWFEGTGHATPDLDWLLPGFRTEWKYYSRPYLTAFAKKWLDDSSDRDFFLWLHYFDPHGPYYPPEEHLPHMEMPEGMGPYINLREVVKDVDTPEERRWARGLYVGEARAVDRDIAEILDELERLGIYDETLIVLTSDHGEEFFDHGGVGHGRTLFDELVHVPLIVKLPASLAGAVSPGTVVDRFVSNTGIMPLILDACGITDYDSRLETHSLSPHAGLGDPAVEPAPLFLAGVLRGKYQEAVIFEGKKYITRPETRKHAKTEALYDLTSDPGETLSLVETHPDDVDKAMTLLEEHHAFVSKVQKDYGLGKKAEEAAIDGKTLQELQALGYMY